MIFNGRVQFIEVKTQYGGCDGGSIGVLGKGKKEPCSGAWKPAGAIESTQAVEQWCAYPYRVTVKIKYQVTGDTSLSRLTAK